MYAVGCYAAKDTPFDPLDTKRMLTRTKELRDGFVFGLAVTDRLAPLKDPDLDSHTGMTIDLLAQTIFRDQTDREQGIRLLEQFGVDNYNEAFGEASINPTNSFHWFVSEFALGLYSNNPRDKRIDRFYGGIGLAHYAYSEMQDESDRKLIEIIAAEDFTMPPL